MLFFLFGWTEQSTLTLSEYIQYPNVPNRQIQIHLSAIRHSGININCINFPVASFAIQRLADGTFTDVLRSLSSAMACRSKRQQN
jgi:hypothetical protein